MRKLFTTLLGLGTILASSIVPLTGVAQPRPDPIPPSREEILSLLDKELPPIIGDDNSELLRRLLNPQLGPPVSKNFNRGNVVRGVFGRTPPTYDPSCARNTTPAGEPAADECIASRGNKSGAGAYTELKFSKNMGFGNIAMFRRPADATLEPASLKPVQLSDEDAYKAGVAFLRSLGVPSEEIPPAPDGAKNPFPVKTLRLGFVSPTGGKGSVAVQKVVMIQRGLLVGLEDLPYVPGPGDAMVALDDSGILHAKVDDWSDLLPNPRLDPKNAKSRRALMDEIADDLVQELQAPIAGMKFRIHIGGIPDGTSKLLLPAVQMSIAQVANDPSEQEQAGAWTTAGLLLDYSLISGTEAAPD